MIPENSILKSVLINLKIIKCLTMIYFDDNKFKRVKVLIVSI